MEPMYQFSLENGRDVQKAEIYDHANGTVVNIALTEEQALRLVDEILTEIEHRYEYRP